MYTIKLDFSIIYPINFFNDPIKQLKILILIVFFFFFFIEGKAKDAPLELIQLCVGSHCLLYYLEPVNNYSYKKRSIHKLLKDFLYDSQITVVGVGIKEVVERLGKERGLFTKSWVELRELAGAEEKCSKGNNFSRPKLAALAKEARYWVKTCILKSLMD